MNSSAAERHQRDRAAGQLGDRRERQQRHAGHHRDRRAHDPFELLAAEAEIRRSYVPLAQRMTIQPSGNAM
jgi:hypothetical protein